jgi:hypothetical protein
MGIAVRFIYNYLHWEIPQEFNVWLQFNEIPADPLSDLNTKKNELSIYLLNKESELDRCIAAFATHRSKGEIRKIDYVIFEEQILIDLDIKYRQKDAINLIDKKITKLHWNLYELSSQKLVRLAMKIMNKNESDVYDKYQVRDLIQDSIEYGWIEIDDLNNGLKRELGL